MRYNCRQPALLASLFVLLCTPAFGADADLTRFGPANYESSPRSPNVARDAFFGVPGRARLVVTAGAGTPADASVTLNGRRVWSTREARFDAARQSAVDVQLVETNALRVEVGDTGAPLTLRIVQHADVPLAITGRIHFNINTNDYERTREFYRRLGFARSIGPFPETNTLIMANAVGMTAPYHMHAELIYLGTAEADYAKLNVPTGRFIDIIHWNDPANTEPAYASVNHLGIGRAVFSTSDLDADMANLRAAGAQFLGPPATRADGSRFAIARDPAGSLVELRQDPGAQPLEANGSHVAAVHHLVVNVSDFERSRAFYRLLGFTSGTPLPETESAEVARAMGLDGPFHVRAEMIRHQRDGSLIELVEWRSPRDLAPPYAPPINHPGMQRVNYASDDLIGDVAALKAQGVRFLSRVAPCCEGAKSRTGIAVFADPDGTFLQLLGAIDPARLAPGAP